MFLRAICILVLVCGTALAVAPPRPQTDVQLPPALHRWEGVRPGAPVNPVDPATLFRAHKSGSAELDVLVIPGGFSDLAGSRSTTAIATVFDGVGAYWSEASRGQFTTSTTVTAWRRAPSSRSHYEGDANGMDMWAAPNNAGRFVLDVVEAADQAGLDWGRYDNDGPDGVPNSGDDDGVVDALVVMHAGLGGECGNNALWSHQFFLAGWGYGRYTTATARSGGGFIVVDDYVLVPENDCDGGIMTRGVICHELGHLLGLPDLYDTVHDHAGVGDWGLMGTGAWNGSGELPALPCAWSRQELGWCEVIDVRQDGGVSLPAVHVQDQVLKVRDPDQPVGEYWLVENRLRTGTEQSLPASGLLIWHVDEGVIDATRHLNEVNGGDVQGVALEAADGQRHLISKAGNRGDAGDPWPGSTGASHFGSTTLPHSHDNTDQFTSVDISGVGSARSPAAFSIVMGVEHLDVTPPTAAFVSPLGGERWTLGDLHTVAWSADDDEELTELELWLSTDGGTTFDRRLAQGLTAVASWRGSIHGQPHDDLRLRLLARDATGNESLVASGRFALCDRYEPGVALTCDLSHGQALDPGDVVSLSWNTADNVAVVAVDLELSCDGGSTWSPTTLVDQAATAASIQWIVPDVSCGDACLRAVARDAAGNRGWDTSVVFQVRGTTTDVPLAARFQLGPCVPNPFNPRAEIRYRVGQAGPVQVTVHDLRGRLVRTLVDGVCPEGAQSVIWDGCDAAGREQGSGVYLVRARTTAGSSYLKVALVR